MHPEEKRVPPSFFHSYTNPVLGHVMTHSTKTHVLVVTMELIWLLLLNILSLNFVPTPNKFLLGWQDSEEALKNAMLSFLPATQVKQGFCMMCTALSKVATFLFLQLFVPDDSVFA